MKFDQQVKVLYMGKSVQKRVATIHGIKLSYKGKVKKLYYSSASRSQTETASSKVIPKDEELVYVWHHQTKRFISLELRESKLNIVYVKLVVWSEYCNLISGSMRQNHSLDTSCQHSQGIYLASNHSRVYINHTFNPVSQALLTLYGAHCLF